MHVDGQTHRHAHISDQCMCSDKTHINVCVQIKYRQIQKKHFWAGTKAQQNHNN